MISELKDYVDQYAEDGKHGVSYWLLNIRALHDELLRTLPNDTYISTDLLMEELALCIVCMMQNGGVRNGLGPVVERIHSRTGYTNMENVFALIKTSGPPWRGREKTDFILYCDALLRGAIDAWVENTEPYTALDQLRELAYALVCCLES